MDRQHTTRAMFGAERALIGCVHVAALPGTPSAHLPVATIAKQAAAEARQYQDAGFHAVMIENMHDRPYLARRVGPEVVAAMAVVGRAVRDAVEVPLGLQVLAGANEAALAVAHAITADVGIADTAHAAEFFLADGLVVTGVATGRAADVADVRAVAEAVSIPVIVGSGITPENVGLYPEADAFIVGTALKRDALWTNPVDSVRAAALRRAFDALPAR